MNEETQYRKIIHYKHYFDDFYKELDHKAKAKINFSLRMINGNSRVTTKFLKQIKGQKGLYEIRSKWKSNIYRIFCCFNEGKLVILFNRFTKKTQKKTKNEIEKAINLMNVLKLKISNMAIKNNIRKPKNCTTFEDHLTREYGVPGSVGRWLFDLSYIDFLKEELKTEKDLDVIKGYKKQIAHYSKKHNLKM